MTGENLSSTGLDGTQLYLGPHLANLQRPKPGFDTPSTLCGVVLAFIGIGEQFTLAILTCTIYPGNEYEGDGTGVLGLMLSRLLLWMALFETTLGAF